MERKYEVKTIEVICNCDECGLGEMLPMGKGITQMDTLWEHKCNKCGEVKWYLNTYPYRKYLRIEWQSAVMD